jgi:methyl-accepting chemotaxis protein
MKLIRILDDIATDLEQQTQAIRDAATAASEVEDSADEQAAAVHARLIVMWNWCRHYAKKLEQFRNG